MYSRIVPGRHGLFWDLAGVGGARVTLSRDVVACVIVRQVSKERAFGCVPTAAQSSERGTHLAVPIPRRLFHSFLQEIVDYFEPQLSVSAAALRARAVLNALHVAESPFS